MMTMKKLKVLVGMVAAMGAQVVAAAAVLLLWGLTPLHPLPPRHRTV
jgi:hypothetical protein